MKLSVALILSLLVFSTMSFNTSPDTKYNWDNHANADDLFVTLANEPQVIFVIFFFKKVAGNAELLKANDSLRNLLKNELVGYDEVTYTEVDLTPEKDVCTTPQGAPPCTTYTKLAKERMGIDVNLLDVSPVVVVMKNGDGSWIHGQGKKVADDKEWGPGRDAFEEVRDSIENFIQASKTKSPSSQKRTGEVVLGQKTAGY